MTEWFKEWWMLLLVIAWVLVGLFLVMRPSAESPSEQRQQLIECVERTDDTEWCLDVIGL